MKVSFNMPGLLKKFPSNNKLGGFTTRYGRAVRKSPSLVGDLEMKNQLASICKFVVDDDTQPLVTIMSHCSFRLVAILELTVSVVLLSAAAQMGRAQQASPAREAPAPLDFQSASAKRMFILVADGRAVAAISVDTMHIEDLRAALKLQELVFRISGARMPIVDKQFVREPGSGCVPGWGKIHIAWDHNPMTDSQHAFEISMKETDSESANPPKQVIIAGSRGAIDSAVSAFTEDALGIPLNALDDKEYKWRQTKTVAIPEKLKTIHGSLEGK
jgi:hypothetical protein